MKAKFLLGLLLLVAVVVKAQIKVNATKIAESQVPAAVKMVYDSTIGFPVKHWEKHETTLNKKAGIKYVAVFEANLQPTRARYREDGNLISYSVYYKADELPPNIKEAALKAFTGMEVKRGEKIDIGKTQKTYYRIVLRKGAGQKSIFWCDLEGNKVEKTKMPIELNEVEDID
jgi:hypothetical protein